MEDKKQGIIKIALKYNSKTKESAINNLTRVSKPGLRKYSGVDTMPRVLNGLGLAIVSTSKGLITDKEARKQNVGGEVLCYVD
jgi:small subunit ribosomal protein S8